MTALTDLNNLARPDWGNVPTEELWSEVAPGLWQGGTADEDTRHDLVRLEPTITADEFQFVTTLYAWANPVDWFVKEIRFGVYDSDMKDFDTTDLFDVVRMTHRAWKRGEKTLVRCQAGWNRSGLVTALVLIRDGMDALDAIQLIRANRSPYALCNRTFAEWLVLLDPTELRAN